MRIKGEVCEGLTLPVAIATNHDRLRPIPPTGTYPIKPPDLQRAADLGSVVEIRQGLVVTDDFGHTERDTDLTLDWF